MDSAYISRVLPSSQCKNRRVDSHGRRSLAVGNEGAPLRFYGESDPRREPNTRGHGSFRRLLSSIISPARGRPRVVSPRGASSSSSSVLTPLAPARARAQPSVFCPLPLFPSILHPGLVSRFFHRPPHEHPIRILTGACLVVCGATVFPRKKRIAERGGGSCGLLRSHCRHQ